MGTLPYVTLHFGELMCLTWHGVCAENAGVPNIPQYGESEILLVCHTPLPIDVQAIPARGFDEAA